MTVGIVDPYKSIPIMDSPPPVIPHLRNPNVELTAEWEHNAREAAVAEAMKWVNTPYVQQSDILGAGIDCSMLLVRAWVDSGLVYPFEPRPYPPNWHLHHSEERYLAWMETLAIEVPEPRRGDCVLFQFGRCYSHGGILISDTQVVQASMKHGTCFVEELSAPWLRYFDKTGKSPRPTKYFDVWARIKQNTELGSTV